MNQKIFLGTALFRSFSLTNRVGDSFADGGLKGSVFNLFYVFILVQFKFMKIQNINLLNDILKIQKFQYERSDNDRFVFRLFLFWFL